MPSPGVVILLVVVAVVVIVLGWFISTVNSFNRMLIKIDESESSIDVALTQRFDMLSKLFQATKGYMKHEQETLQKVIAMRQPAHGAPMAEKQAFSDELAKGLSAINVVVEQYPELKANDSVNNLQNATIEVEENLQAARRVYNSNVSYYNQKVVVFPSSIIANMRNFQKRPFFEAEAQKRQDVKFDF